MVDEPQASGEHRALRSLGLTLLGVIASIAVTVGFGITGAWWIRTAAAVATAAGLLVVIKLSTRSGAKGPVAKIADWITGTDTAA